MDVESKRVKTLEQVVGKISKDVLSCLECLECFPSVYQFLLFPFVLEGTFWARSFSVQITPSLCYSGQ